MRITQLQPQVNNTERVNIYVDGQFLQGASTLVVLQLQLRVGQELTAEQLARLRYEEALQQAVDRALNYLSFRPRSREEVKRYLRRKETPVDLIDSVLERLDTLNLINDEEFASFWISSREQFKPRGARALRNELRMKGVAREVTDELVDESQDEQRALLAGRKKALSLMRLPGMDYKTFYSRLGSFLQRRGFNYETTTRTVKILWQEQTDEQQEP